MAVNFLLFKLISMSPAHCPSLQSSLHINMANTRKLDASASKKTSFTSTGARPKVTAAATNASKSAKENLASQGQAHSSATNSKKMTKNSSTQPKSAAKPATKPTQAAKPAAEPATKPAMKPIPTHTPSSKGAKDAEAALLARIAVQEGWPI